jgi:hypothetical protein
MCVACDLLSCIQHTVMLYSLRWRRGLVALLLVVAAAGTVLGVAGASTLLVERRLAGLARERLEVARLHYNPLTGALTLDDVRVRGDDGGALFTARRVTARLAAGASVAGPLRLARVRLVAPAVQLRPWARAELRRLADVQEIPEPTAWPVTVDGLAVTRGSITLESEDASPPLRLEELTLRVDAVAASAADGARPAFALAVSAYGADLHVTGQPHRQGYAVHVRGRGIDVGALVRDLVAEPPELGGDVRADVVGEAVLAGNRVLVSGEARLGPFEVDLARGGRARLRAAGGFLAVDRVDVAAGTGRVSRLDLDAPRLTVVAEAALPPPELDARLVDVMRAVVLRRLSVADGALAVVDRRGRPAVSLARVAVTAIARERPPSSPVRLTASATVDGGGRIALAGQAARDLSAGEADVTVEGVALAPWRPLLGALGDVTGGRLSFTGRLTAARGDTPRATARGRLLVEDLALAPDGVPALSLDALAADVRHAAWPGGAAALDSLALVGPAWTADGLAGARGWRLPGVRGALTVTDGVLRSSVPGAAPVLRDVELALEPATDAAGPRLTISAVTADGARLSTARRLAGTPTPSLGPVIDALGDLAAADVAPGPAWPAPGGPGSFTGGR